MRVSWLRGLMLALFWTSWIPNAFAQGANPLASGVSVGRFNLNLTTLTYCHTEGSSGGVVVAPLTLTSLVKTTGSSTTFVAVTAASAPFLNFIADDVLVIPASVTGGDPALRSIVSKASNDQVVVDEAVDLTATGTQLQGYRQRCGTTATSGLISVAGLTNVSLTLQIDQMSGTGGIDAAWFCRTAATESLFVQVFPDNSAGAAVRNYAAAGADARTTVQIANNLGYAWCRVGLKWNTADDGGDTGANRERISVYVSGEVRQK